MLNEFACDFSDCSPRVRPAEDARHVILRLPADRFVENCIAGVSILKGCFRVFDIFKSFDQLKTDPGPKKAAFGNRTGELKFDLAQ